MNTLERRIADRIVADDPRADRDDAIERVAAITADAESLGISRRDVIKTLTRWYNAFPQRRHLWLTADSSLANLRQVVIEEGTTRRERTWYRLAAAPGWVIDHYIAVASLVIAIATAFYGVAYSRFYGSLDATPEDIGIAPAQILTHSAVGGLALTAVIAVSLYCTLIPVVPIRDDVEASTEPGKGSHLLVNAMLTAAGAGVLLVILQWANVPKALIPYVEATVGAVFIGASFRLGFAKGDRPGLRPLHFSSERYLIAAIVTVAAGLFLAAFITLNRAGTLGSRVNRGEAVSDPKIFGVPFLGVRAEPVLISWMTNSRPRPGTMPHCALYLGSSNGSSVFYDHRSHRTFRVPSDAITVDSRAGMSNCEAPINASLPTIHVRGKYLVCVPGRWHSPTKPNFKFEWISEGHSISTHEEPLARLLKRDDWIGLALRCRVIATTILGEDRAVSRRIVVPFWVAERNVR